MKRKLEKNELVWFSEKCPVLSPLNISGGTPSSEELQNRPNKN